MWNLEQRIVFVVLKNSIEGWAFEFEWKRDIDHNEIVWDNTKDIEEREVQPMNDWWISILSNISTNNEWIETILPMKDSMEFDRDQRSKVTLCSINATKTFLFELLREVLEERADPIVEENELSLDDKQLDGRFHIQVYQDYKSKRILHSFLFRSIERSINVYSAENSKKTKKLN